MPDRSFHPHVLIPQEHIGWYIEQPESVLNVRSPQVGRFALNYLDPMLDTHQDMYLMDVLRKDVTRNLARLQPAIYQGMKESVDNIFGTDGNTIREIRLFDVMSKIVFKSQSRVFVGPPLCQDQTFLAALAFFAKWLGAGGIIVGQYTPKVFKALIGYPAAIPIFISKRIAFRYLVPEIKKRLARLEQKRSNPEMSWEQPSDMLGWVVNAAADRKHPQADRPEAIAERIMFLMLGGIHTTIITATNAFVDLLSSPQMNFDRLREETASIFRSEEDWKDHDLLRELIYTDSTIRETLRLSPPLSRLLLREVAAEKGLQLPDGQRLSKGTWVAVTPVGVHSDERFYSNPEHYEPFRFVERLKPKEAAPDDEKNQSSLFPSGKPQGLSTASDTYLAFGYGRHSCPGRWFVAFQLKLLLAYIIKYYDFEPLKNRPPYSIFGDSIIPFTGTVLKVKRRNDH
ncbi:hypothetical protein ACLMJK_008218 [Lecanora helva]